MIAPALLLLGHGATGVALLVVGLRRGGAMTPVILPALLGLAAGPVGALVALVMQRLLRRFPGGAATEDWAERLGGRGIVSDRRMVDRVADDRIRQPSPGDLASLYDMQRFGGVPIRQRVIATAVRSFEPRLAPVISRALIDPDQSVRAQAAAAATDYQNSFTTRRRALEVAADGPRGAYARRDLALLLAANSSVTIFSEKVRATLLAEAIVLLEKLRANGAGSPQIDRTLARLLIARGSPDHALALLDECAAADDGGDAAVIGHIEAMFRADEFERLRGFCANLIATRRVNGPKLAPIIEFWGAQPAT